MINSADQVQHWLQHAFELQGRGDLAHAGLYLESAVEAEPNNHEALQLLGINHALLKNHDIAIEMFEKALQSGSDKAQTYFNRANAHLEMGLFQKGMIDIEAALELDSDNESGYLTKALFEIKLNHLESAINSCSKVIEINPQNSKAYQLRAWIHKKNGDMVQAIADASQAIMQDANNHEAFNFMGLIMMNDMGKTDEAIQFFTVATSLDQNNPEYFSNLGKAIERSGNYEKAMMVFDHALTLDPNHALGYAYKASTYSYLDKYDEAIKACEKALSINPEMVSALQILASLQFEKGDCESALLTLDKALTIQPDCVDTLNTKANIISSMGQNAKATEIFDRCIEKHPNYLGFQWNKSLHCLLHGDYENGWKLYESGWNLKFRVKPKEIAATLWLGQESLQGKTILLLGEQGYGDMIHFCRYVPMVKHLGATVILDVPKELAELMSTLSGVDEIVSEWNPLRKVDYYCPLMSLPMVFGSTLTNLPADIPYLSSDIEKRNYWESKFLNTKKMRIGIVWKSGDRFNKPRVLKFSRAKNIDTDLFASALSQLDVQFVSLQKGEPAESELRHIQSTVWSRGNLLNFTDEIKNFADTAALISQLDLVISVCTATAHLSAAMGKPTWILLHKHACWRWLQNRKDSPWYPTVKLFRQKDFGNWTDVLYEVVTEINQLKDQNPSVMP